MSVAGAHAPTQRGSVFVPTGAVCRRRQGVEPVGRCRRQSEKKTVRVGETKDSGIPRSLIGAVRRRRAATRRPRDRIGRSS